MAVATRNRTAVAVLADMIEGVIVSAQVPNSGVGALRDGLWASVDAQLGAHYLDSPGAMVAAS